MGMTSRATWVPDRGKGKKWRRREPGDGGGAPNPNFISNQNAFFASLTLSHCPELLSSNSCSSLTPSLPSNYRLLPSPSQLPTLNSHRLLPHFPSFAQQTSQTSFPPSRSHRSIVEASIAQPLSRRASSVPPRSCPFSGVCSVPSRSPSLEGIFYFCNCNCGFSLLVNQLICDLFLISLISTLLLLIFFYCVSLCKLSMRLMGCCKPVILILETLQTLKTLLMGNIMCKHCMNRSVLLVRLFPGISVFSCLLGRERERIMAQHDDLSAPPRPLPPSPSPTKTDPRAIHARAIKSVATDNATFNNLVTLYSKLESLASYSVRVFSQIRSPNVVSWTALVSAHSNTLLALRYFVSMLRHPTLPNNRTLASLFRTSAALFALPFALSLHSLSLKLALSSDPFAGSALLSFYFKCRMPDHAHKVFDEIPDRDSVCYSAMIVGLAQNSRSVDALLVLADMRHRGFASTEHSVSGGLRAAAELAALEQCRMIHGHAVVAGFDSNVVVGSALVDGYGKAGVVENARQVFEDNLAWMNLVGWNAMMAGYAQQGDHKSTSELFDSMECQGLVPDEYSFLAMLTALYNAGMFLEADQWLTRMKVDYGLQPTLVHYTCFVGAMARAGHLEQAERVALTMPYEPDAAVWRALLSACAFHGEADKAWSMARRVLELEPLDDSAYVIVANVLSAAGRWDDVAELRKMLRVRRVKKQGGRSWIEIQGKVHVFAAGDWKHKRSAEIYRKLQEIMGEIEKLGYVPIWDELLHNVEEEKRKEALWHHSEKLAVAFGVLCGSAPPGKPLRIVKNLRICKDCHEAFKYMTRILQREIIVRDVNRYHRFVDGNCTCRDIW